MLKVNGIFWCFLLIFNFSSFAQEVDGFQFHRPNKKRYKIKFTNYNNLIIINAKLNGRSMNFLLDTGVESTVLFGLEGDEESIKNSSQKILIRGVSGKRKTYAYKNQNNILEIGKLNDDHHNVYAIFDQDFNISDKIGYQVQGILGYSFFKDVIIKVDYISNRLVIYNPDHFSEKLKSYQKMPIILFKQKPYVKAELKIKDQYKRFAFLLDSGSGDAIWVRNNDRQDTLSRSFDDILGYGFADIITGKRTKAEAFRLGSKEFRHPKIAYPDTLSYQGPSFSKNSGVIGSEIMRRFHWVFDYEHRMVYFKANSDFSDKFNYDMSGLLLKLDGFQAITNYVSVFSKAEAQTDNSAGYGKIKDSPKVSITLRPIFKVGAVRPNSSAFKAGFVEGDEILKINGRNSFKFDLQEINRLLSSEEGKKINFEIKRGGRIYDKSLILKSRFLE